MTISLTQSASAASSTAAPTSITPTFGGASVSGSLLILVVGVVGTAPTITDPGGPWVLIAKPTAPGPPAAIQALYVARNAAPLTSQAVTTSGGGIVASMFEYANIGPLAATEQVGSGGGTGNAWSPPFLGSPNQPGNALTDFNELLFASVLNDATATSTSTSDPNWSTNVAGTNSTNGTNGNARISNFWLNNNGSPTLFPQLSGTFSASVTNLAIVPRFLTINSYPIVRTNVGGVEGVYVPVFFQGMTGG